MSAMCLEIYYRYQQLEPERMGGGGMAGGGAPVIEVPPDIMARAELGNHFETMNLDRPDTHGAFSDPDAHMFHSVNAGIDSAGGGGNSGVTLEDK